MGSVCHPSSKDVAHVEERLLVQNPEPSCDMYYKVGLIHLGWQLELLGHVCQLAPEVCTGTRTLLRADMHLKEEVWGCRDKLL